MEKNERRKNKRRKISGKNIKEKKRPGKRGMRRVEKAGTGRMAEAGWESRQPKTETGPGAEMVSGFRQAVRCPELFCRLCAGWIVPDIRLFALADQGLHLLFQFV